MRKKPRKQVLHSVCFHAVRFLLPLLCVINAVHAFSFVPIRRYFSSPCPTPLKWQSCTLSVSGCDDDKSDQINPEQSPAGSFFHKVPPSDDDSLSVDDNSTYTNDDNIEVSDGNIGLDDEISKLLQQRRKKTLASRPSTINGVPSGMAKGFGQPNKGTDASKKTGRNKPSDVTKIIKNKNLTPYVAIGTPDQPINDPSKPERDDQGYTLYTDTQTGEKSRVFEALVDYPSIFTMKIVGANEGTFISDVVALVAEACETDVSRIKHSTKVMGKWVSVTVKAPVQSAEMLYSLYEKVDLDSRVKFKF